MSKTELLTQVMLSSSIPDLLQGLVNEYSKDYLFSLRESQKCVKYTVETEWCGISATVPFHVFMKTYYFMNSATCIKSGT